MFIDLLPIWALFFATVAIVFISVEIGFRIGRRVRLRDKGERESTASSTAGVILGLVAFILAFTFNMVSGRYDTKKALVREEANAIHTAWQLSDLLQESASTRSKELLQEYIDQRISVANSGSIAFAKSQLGDALRIQQQLWKIAVENGRIDLNSDVGALYVKSMNQIAEIHAMRVNIGLQARLPTAIWLVLYSMLILGMAGIGYHTSIADSRRSYVPPVLAIAFSLIITLIAALDHPGGQMLPVSQQPLINVQSEMRSVTDPAR